MTWSQIKAQKFCLWLYMMWGHPFYLSESSLYIIIFETKLWLMSSFQFSCPIKIAWYSNWQLLKSVDHKAFQMTAYIVFELKSFLRCTYIEQNTLLKCSTKWNSTIFTKYAKYKSKHTIKSISISDLYAQRLYRFLRCQCSCALWFEASCQSTTN